VTGDVKGARETWTELTRVVEDDRLRSRVETGLAFAALAQGELPSAQHHLAIALDLDSLNRVAFDTLKATQRIAQSKERLAIGNDLIESDSIQALITGI
jgi:hypothetical protein